MVAGNSVAYPNTPFNSFRVLTANIVIEMGYAGEVQQGALVATGLVLLAFVLIVNLIFGAVSKRVVTGATGGSGKISKIFKTKIFKTKSFKTSEKTKKITFFTECENKISALKYKLKTANIGACASIFSGVIAGAALILIIGFIFINGLPTLIKSPHLLFGKYEFNSEKITLLPSIVTTLMTVGLSLLISVPIGLCTAIYLNEYAKKSSFIIKIIRGAIDLLNGVPSIVYGLFGMITFVVLLGGNSSILAGTLTISIMLLPTIVRSCEESLRSVQDGLREGSFALGAGKLRTIFKITLPSALPGIASAVVLAMGRVIAESAPFIYTMGSVISGMPSGYLDSNATLAVALYRLSGEGWYINESYAAAVLLILLVLGLNLVAELIFAKLNKKLKGE